MALLLLLLQMISVSCSEEAPDFIHSEEFLHRYATFSKYTDPGGFGYLYKDLPESVEDICSLIKSQLIHPFDIEKFGDKIPVNRMNEDESLQTVEEMLNALLNRNNSGLNVSRKPEERLVVACVHHSMLLASILRYKGIPVRLRAGNAKYIGGDKRIRVTHVICEVWDKNRNKWYLVDPDRNRIDFSRNEFEFAGETWQKLRDGDINKRYYISRYKTVDQATAHLVWLDLSYILRAEEPYWKDPEIVTGIENSLNDLTNSEIRLLDNIAALLNSPDSNLSDLERLKADNKSLNFE
ncbi:MAG: transglutaminase-like domain-containing protein [Ignavibacteriales bacterium]|nr:transglutaminase-like domain-containing protein [Ignavibacteriales bacterium]MCF8305108.1 transglutaminase-like domain-containing protein [Ignavibacteriales bacterium]MCF8314978.1 transglutaminase-like domain-containing protein [Ignavibacteriales bacterium]MCF8436072.1 transglutaminase-like domain-containing protein [Ignavibacteriales bacterium]